MYIRIKRICIYICTSIYMYTHKAHMCIYIHICALCVYSRERHFVTRSVCVSESESVCVTQIHVCDFSCQVQTQIHICECISQIHICEYISQIHICDTSCQVQTQIHICEYISQIHICDTPCQVQRVPEKMRLEMVLTIQNEIICIPFLIQECVCVCVCVYTHACMYVCINLCVPCEKRCGPCLIAFLMIQERASNAKRSLLECTTKSFGFRNRNQETTVLGLFIGKCIWIS